MSRKAKFMLDEHRTSDGDGQAEAGGEEDRVLSPTTNARHRGDLTGSESRRRDDRAQQCISMHLDR